MNSTAFKARRLRLGYSQAGLAAKLGVDPQTVSRWERGEHRIPPMVTLAMQTVKPERRGKRK